MTGTRGLGLATGFALDRLLGDPRRGHPVALFGSTASRFEAVTYGDRRGNGIAHVALLVGGTTIAARLVERRRSSLLATALATWTVLGGRSLEREALAVHAYLDAGDLPNARRRLTHLVGRDTGDLTGSDVARAVVESVAENTSDAVVAPLFWGAFAGVPGLLGYRAVNTLDAMIGHHNDRYENFGWAAARLDDLANLPAARLGGLAVLAARPASAGEAWRAWRRDARKHPSPNAGVIEAAFAGSLGIRLGGTNRYHGERVEHRVVMGDGRPAEACDIAAAVHLARRVDRIALAIAVLLALIAGRRR